MSLSDPTNPSVGLRNFSPVQQPDPVPDPAHSVFSDAVFGAGTGGYKPDPTSVDSAKRIAGLFMKEGELNAVDANAFLLNQSTGQSRLDALLGASAHLLEQPWETLNANGTNKHVIIVVDSPGELANFVKQSQRLGYQVALPEEPELEVAQKTAASPTSPDQIVKPDEVKTFVEEEKKKLKPEAKEKGWFESLRDWVASAYHYVANGFSSEPAAPALAAQDTKAVAPKQSTSATAAPANTQSKAQSAKPSIDPNAPVTGQKAGDPAIVQKPGDPATAVGAKPQGAPAPSQQSNGKNPAADALKFAGDRLKKLSQFDGSPESLVKSGLFDFPEPKKPDPSIKMMQEILAELKKMNGESVGTSVAATPQASNDNKAPNSKEPANDNHVAANDNVDAKSKINVTFIPPGGKLPDTITQPTITLVTYDQLAEVLKNANPDNIAMVACERADRLMANPEALQAMEEFKGNRVYATSKASATLENMVEFECLMRDNRKDVTPDELVQRFHEADLKSPISDASLGAMGVDATSSLITDLDKFKKGVIRAEVMADLGLEEKDGKLHVASPEQFQEAAQNRAFQRLALGTSTAVEPEFHGEIAAVQTIAADPSLKLGEATQAVIDYKAPRVALSLVEVPPVEAQVNALNEYARASAVADRVIAGVEAGESVVLYANQERIAAPGLQNVEPWKDILVDGKIPTISDVVSKRVEEHAAAHPDFAAKLGSVHNLDRLSTPRDMALASRDFDTPLDKVVSSDSKETAGHSSLVIADPSLSTYMDLSRKHDGASPTSVVIAGISSHTPNELAMDMARSTSRPGATSPTKCEMTFTDSDHDKKQLADLTKALNIKEAHGSGLAGVMAGKLEESLGVPQGNPLRQSAAVSMPQASTHAMGASLTT